MLRRSDYSYFKTRRCTKTKEGFDLVFGTFPNRLYVLTDDSGQYAITGEANSDYIVIKPVDKKNKYQWVLVDADTGLICFFTDLKNYMNIDVTDGIVHVKRSDVINNGTFVFNPDHTISLKNNYTDYCLAFNKSKLKSEDKESFIRKLVERFNPDVDTPLEVVKITDIDLNVYSNKWKFELVYDLRELTDTATTIEELTEINNTSDSQIKSLQQLIENNKKKYDEEISYKDNKIKDYTDLINRYESNWFVRWFLKK